MEIKIHSDVFDIINRLKKIDESYYLVFNTKKQKYELHSTCQKNNTYCLTIPYQQLDERTIFLARKTRRENKDKLLKEMEEENQKLEKEKIKQLTRRVYGS